MKSSLLCLLVFLSILQTVHARDLAVMVKQHTNHTRFDDRPFGNGDLSYGAFLEFFDGPSGWRLGAMYTPEVTGDLNIDTVITPEITLLLQDGLWEAGISALIDYLDDGEDTGWGDVYYQFQLGLNFSLGKSMSVGAHALYPFDSFRNIGDFRFRNLDYAAVLRFRF